MLSLPIAFSSAIGIFAPVFSRPVWQHVKVLMTGAVLAPGQRTVTAILRIMGRSTAPNFQTYHRVLNRAVWSPLHASRLLLRLLVAVFVPRGVVLHLRVLNASAPMQPHVPSCYLTLSVGVYTGSLFQPGTHGCFLMHPAPWTATEKAA